jgi:hypothetical protein
VLDLTPDDHEFLRDLGSFLAFQYLAEFEHRIVNVVTGEPWYVLQMVKTSDVTVECHTRQSIARRILDTPDGQLAVNLLKWKRRHAQDLEQAASNGTLPPNRALSTLLLVLRQHCIADTTNVEGINSIIKVWTQRCPHMRLELLSARVATKLFLLWLASRSGVQGRNDMEKLCCVATSTYRALQEFNKSELHCQLNTSTRWMPETNGTTVSDSLVLASSMRHYPLVFGTGKAACADSKWAANYHGQVSKATSKQN